ncbi:hypothetical protein [Sulfurospirillum oryzae]|uniref:hypothetical protein n=1 Tax=Sulfurospirillum oryzae TaxID=2976535 RepID=UPI0021E767B4|nr:hypothetical protein [Sulfurospirillum oryzae]
MNHVLRTLLTLLFATSALFFSGCATKRGEVALQVPTTKAEAVPSNGQQIYINSVVDRRMFEPKPTDPSTPSLDPSEAQSDTIKARAVGRKRNGYGMALGDILLNEDQNVNSVVKNALKEALTGKGYQVIENKDQITPQTYMADVKIVKFWSWMNMGFLALTISCEIETKVDLKKEVDAKTYNVHVKAADSFQTGMESNYLEVMQKALQQYIAEAKVEIK